MAIGKQRPDPALSGGADPFTDLLFNMLLGFILLFFIAILFLKTAEDHGKIDIEAEYVITVTWPDFSPDDIDTWIQDPQGEVIWYRNKSSSIVHLDRDDRGMLNDRLKLGDSIVENPLNQEVVAIRGMLPGEYIVNLHYYDSQTGNPVTASVKVARVNPVYTIAWYDTLTLNHKGEEKTALRFTLASDGSIGNINHLPRTLRPK